jgi:uncharacterized protein YneF (UPF0154 family)
MTILSWFTTDPHSTEFKILVVVSEVVVTLIVFIGFYFVFKNLNNRMKKHRKDNPEIRNKK